MASVSDNNKAISDILPKYLLDEFIDWIVSHMPVEDVFPQKDLEEWAKDNGYIKQEDC